VNPVNTPLTLDTVKFLKSTIDEALADFEHAYPGNYLDKDKAHTALQNIKSRLRVLNNFLNALEKTKPEKDEA
jgi:NH3-dependent NAD+ synthetase